MPNYILPTNNTDTLDKFVAIVSTNVPILPNLLLVGVFLTILLGGYFSKSRREGEKAGNFPLWMAIAGLITTTGAFILYMADGIVNITSVVICVSVAIISAMWAMFTPTE